MGGGEGRGGKRARLVYRDMCSVCNCIPAQTVKAHSSIDLVQGVLSRFVVLFLKNRLGVLKPMRSNASRTDRRRSTGDSWSSCITDGGAAIRRSAEASLDPASYGLARGAGRARQHAWRGNLGVERSRLAGARRFWGEPKSAQSKIAQLTFIGCDLAYS